MTRPATAMRIHRIAAGTALAVLAWGALASPQAPPAGPAAATVLGAAVDTTDPAALRDAILTPLLDRYAAERGIKAEPGETEAFVAQLRQGSPTPGLTAAEAAEVEAQRQAMARGIVRQWKINQALYAQYGGRLVYQQLGPEPLDAVLALLRQCQADRAFTIHDPRLAEEFWRYFTDDSRHDFMAPGGADAARAFKTPPWEDRSATGH